MVRRGRSDYDTGFHLPRRRDVRRRTKPRRVLGCRRLWRLCFSSRASAPFGGSFSIRNAIRLLDRGVLRVVRLRGHPRRRGVRAYAAFDAIVPDRFPRRREARSPAARTPLVRPTAPFSSLRVRARVSRAPSPTPALRVAKPLPRAAWSPPPRRRRRRRVAVLRLLAQRRLALLLRVVKVGKNLNSRELVGARSLPVRPPRRSARPKRVHRRLSRRRSSNTAPIAGAVRAPSRRITSSNRAGRARRLAPPLRLRHRWFAKRTFRRLLAPGVARVAHRRVHVVAARGAPPRSRQPRARARDEIIRRIGEVPCGRGAVRVGVGGGQGVGGQGVGVFVKSVRRIRERPRRVFASAARVFEANRR